MTMAWRIALLDETEPEYPPEAVRYGLLRAGRPDRTSRGWIARDGRQPVALCTVVLKRGETRAWMPELWVLPSHRRRGIGTELLERAVDFARRDGRTVITANHYEGAAASIAFCARHGATEASATEQNRVRADVLDRSLLERWATPVDGCSLVTFDDVCPDELVDDVVRIARLVGNETLSRETRRAEEAAMRADGTTQWVVLVHDRRSGTCAGMTELTIEPFQPWLVHQGTTAVDPAHRGRGIGRWLKAVNALRLLDERPETRVIETWNDGTNAAMLTINREMGFRAVAIWRDVELALRP